jgi:hypothetical protein
MEQHFAVARAVQSVDHASKPSPVLQERSIGAAAQPAINGHTEANRPAPFAVSPSPTSQSSPAFPPQPEDRSVLRLDEYEIATLIKRGKDYLAHGDIASARLLLRRAAEAGSAEAALTLGSTFDPLTIARLGAVGIGPDIALARKWYQRAVQLGSAAAALQLAKLAQEYP